MHITRALYTSIDNRRNGYEEKQASACRIDHTCDRYGDVVVCGCQTDDPVGDTEVNGGEGSKGDVVIDNGGSGTSADGKSAIVNGVDAFASFEVKAGDSSDIVVTDLSTGKRIQGVTVSAALDQAGIFIVNPLRADGLTGSTSGSRFTTEEDSSIIPRRANWRFTVARPDVYDVQMSGDFKTFTASSNITVTETNTDNEGNTYGSVVFRNVTGGFGGFEKGEIFLIEQADGTQAAYKALSDASVINNMVSVNYVKPDFSEVFSEFNYKERPRCPTTARYSLPRTSRLSSKTASLIWLRSPYSARIRL